MSESFNNQTNADKRRPGISPIFTGFIVGFAIPFGCGVVGGAYVAIREHLHYASHPLQANEARCGMGMMLPFILVFLIAPVCSVFGAIGSWLDQRSSK
jgi:hypothetical protein